MVALPDLPDLPDLKYNITTLQLKATKTRYPLDSFLKQSPPKKARQVNQVRQRKHRRASQQPGHCAGCLTQRRQPGGIKMILKRSALRDRAQQLSYRYSQP